jgi:hypothetical protein
MKRAADSARVVEENVKYLPSVLGQYRSGTPGPTLLRVRDLATAIRGYVDILNGERFPAERQAALLRIVSEKSLALADLVEGLFEDHRGVSIGNLIDLRQWAIAMRQQAIAQRSSLAARKRKAIGRGVARKIAKRAPK